MVVCELDDVDFGWILVVLFCFVCDCLVDLLVDFVSGDVYVWYVWEWCVVVVDELVVD